MDQSEICLSYKHRDLCVTFRSHVLKVGMLPHNYNPSAREVEKENLWVFLESWGAPVQWQTLFQNQYNMGMPKEQQPRLSSGLYKYTPPLPPPPLTPPQPVNLHKSSHKAYNKVPSLYQATFIAMCSHFQLVSCMLDMLGGEKTFSSLELTVALKA